MTSKMIEKFDKYWSKMNGLLAVASILNLRTSWIVWIFYFKEIYKGEATHEIERITTFGVWCSSGYQDRKVEVPIVENPIFATLGNPLVNLPHPKRDLVKKIVVTDMQHIRKPKGGR